MKLIIDIPDKDYEKLKDGHIPFSILNVMQNGTPIPDNATNGDVIKAMFPNLEIEYTDTDEYTNKPRYVKLIVGDTIITRMSADSWNVLINTRQKVRNEYV